MDLNEIRQKIDLLDDQLLELFLKRLDLAEEVAEYKKAHHLPVLNRTREREILARVTQAAGERERYAYQLFTALFELARTRQLELIGDTTRVGELVRAALEKEQPMFPQTGLVACQGVEGGNSQMACDRLLPRGRIVYVKTFEAVFNAVESGLCRFGVVPIENSSNGSIRAVYDLLQRKNFSIVRSTRLHIRHELLALPGVSLEDIREIHSHEQALGQCSNYLAGLRDVHVLPAENTAEAARLVAESGSRNAAAIASHGCADLYGLEVVKTDIQNSDNNYTRFICITKEPELYAGSTRISLITACDNKPGALNSILSKFNALGINMLKLESNPVSGQNYDFIFYIELDAHLRDRGVLSMLEELERTTPYFHFLGAYSEV